MIYDRLYVQFLYYFNIERDYFECHEVMEELWLEEGRSKLYQGLLQVAVGLHHFRNGNIAGAIKLMEAATSKLVHYPDGTLGINLAKLRQEAEAYTAKLVRYHVEPFEFYDLDIEIVDAELAAAVMAIRSRDEIEAAVNDERSKDETED
jgi:uncharacterized protein